MSKLSLAVQNQSLALASSPAEVKNIETLAAAAKRYAQSLEERNYAAEVQLRAGRRGGEMLIEMAERGERAKNPGVANGPLPTLADLGIEPMRSSRWQWLARMPAEKFEAYIAKTKDAAERITVAGLVGIEANSGENDWYTPAPYIAAARAVMGDIDLDPASTADANEVVGAVVYFTADDDGLSQPWRGRVWMNPPYSQPLVWQFCEKLAEEYANEAVSEACVLVNNATETAFFQRLAEVASAICFPAGRVKFWHPDRVSSAPLQGQAVIYLGPNADSFRAEFLAFGFTVGL